MKGFPPLLAFPWILLLTGCHAMAVQKNFDGKLPLSEIAVLRDRGYRFWLYDGPKKPVDELRLKPGRYMIGFRESYTQTGGAAYCDMEAGQLYSFRITGRQYLPKVGLYALMGDCYVDPQREDSAYKDELQAEGGANTKQSGSQWSLRHLFGGDSKATDSSR